MPITSSAKKALRKDRRRADINKPKRTKVRLALRTAKETQSLEHVSQAHSVIDRAAKTGVIHQNTASRLKSRLHRFVKKQSS